MGRYWRRNYLINSRFQLRWALFIAVLGAFIATSFASFLWSSLNDQKGLLAELMRTNENTLGATENVEVLLLNMPETTAKDAAEFRVRFEKQLQSLEDSNQIRANMIEENARLRPYLVAFVVFLFVSLFLLGIFVTHRIAGPMYVIKTQLATYRATGAITPRSLRRGDEFQEVYDELQQALGKTSQGDEKK
jgi:hypothetical protein